MCGRISQHSGFISLSIVEGIDAPDRPGGTNHPPRYNGAPSQELLVIRRNHKRGEISLEPIKWGFIPVSCEDAKGGVKPINARAETIKTSAMFKAAYARRRCIVPVDVFFEWKAVKGGKTKQAYAIGMKDGSPFGLAGLWENWQDPKGEWVRTFTIITTRANELVGEIHHRMPVIVKPADYLRWLGEEQEADALLQPFDAGLMRMWPISARVNSPRNDDAGILRPVD